MERSPENDDDVCLTPPPSKGGSPLRGMDSRVDSRKRTATYNVAYEGPLGTFKPEKHIKEGWRRWTML